MAAGVKVKGRGDSFFMDEGAVRGHGGSRQVSFIPRGGAGGSRGRGGRAGGAGQWEAASRDGSRDLKKRGVQSLGLKSDRPGFGGRGGRVGRGFRGRGRGRS